MQEFLQLQENLHLCPLLPQIQAVGGFAKTVENGFGHDNTGSSYD